MRFEELKATFFLFLFGLGIIFFIMTLPGCASTTPPPIDVQFWAGDSIEEGISRTQEKRFIECKASEFDEYVCLTYDDLKKIYEALLQCEDWSYASSKNLEPIYY